MDKEEYVSYIQNIEYFSALRKEENPVILNNMDNLEAIILNKINQRKTNFVCYHLICGVNDVLINLIIGIFSQYIHIANNCCTLKHLTILFVN